VYWSGECGGGGTVSCSEGIEGCPATTWEVECDYHYPENNGCDWCCGHLPGTVDIITGTTCIWGVTRCTTNFQYCYIGDVTNDCIACDNLE
jgi:hypothetical protein